MSGSFEQHLKRDEELVKTALERLLFREGSLLFWFLLMAGICLSIVFIRP